MLNKNPWKKYCRFYDKSFQEQMEYSNKRPEKYFSKWKTTCIPKKLEKTNAKRLKDVPIITYSDYPMLHSFATKIAE